MNSKDIVGAVNTVTTLIHFTRDQIMRLDGLVYLYDPNWDQTSDPDTLDTLPFAFLEVTKETIIHKNEVSKKRLILFEPPNANKEGSVGFQKGVINIVADNVVNDPVLHKLECLVPADAITRIFSRSLKVVEDISNHVSYNIPSLYGSNVYDVLRRSFKIFATSFLGLMEANKLMQKMIGVFKSEKKPVLDLGLVSQIGSGLDVHTLDYNRRSLFLMSKNRAILKYKSWTGWDIKHVIINNLEITKVGVEDDYYRATLELMEVPILYVGPTSLGYMGAPENLNTKGVRELSAKVLDVN